MDFFERQEKARKNTGLLVVYFALAIAGIIVAVYLASLITFVGVETKTHRPGQVQQFSWWNPQVFGVAAIGTLVIIVCGSATKIAQLASGGGVVAESLGGRLIDPNTPNLNERKLFNVVEEMAIASGVPMPKVYVMDDEHGINAFAAGHNLNDAAVCVTRGCMSTLKRDELQGVIGHEFSHILNGDMRINLRLMGLIFGILCLTVIGRILLRTRGKKNPLPILGIALIIIGWLGVFFGRLIQAAVSRQREFLADASAVQFTRNPAGLSGALQKIGGFAYGSKLQTEHAEEASHMFFGNGLGQSMFSLMTTHPPLEDRIRAIDPQWDGKFPDVEEALDWDGEENFLPTKRGLTQIPPPLPILSPFPIGAAGIAPTIVRAQSIMPTVGKPTPQHLRYAEELRESYPENVRQATRDPFSAVALIYAILLSDDVQVRAQQLTGLATQAPPTIHQRTSALFPEVASAASRAQLPLVNLALPALRRLAPGDHQAFIRTLKWLIESDAEINLFEFALQKIVRRNLESQFSDVRAPVAQYYTLKPLLPDCEVLLSSVANVGAADPAEVAKAFQRGAPYLRAVNQPLTLLPLAQCGLDKIDTALNRLALAVPQIKRNLLEACVQVVAADGIIQEREAEMLRAVAETLDCPMPPFLEPGN